MVIAIASMYPASRIVVKPIYSEYTSMLDNMPLLRKLKYDFCKCYVILEQRYVYTKGILIVLLLQKLRYVSYKCNALLN